MFYLLPSIVMCVLAAAVFYLMCRVTNAQIAGHLPVDIGNDTPDATTEESVTPYTASAAIIAIGVACALLCAAAVYAAFHNVLSLASRVELCVCLLGLLAAAVIDAKLRIIPNYIPLSFAAVRLLVFVYELFTISNAMQYMVGSLIGFALCALLLIAANKLSKGGIGGGDIKLLAAVGFLCGLNIVFEVLLLALIWCVVFAIIPLLRRKTSLKGHTPFGPYLFLGFLTVCLLLLH